MSAVTVAMLLAVNITDNALIDVGRHPLTRKEREILLDADFKKEDIENINDENSVIPFIDTEKYHELKNTGTISQGMIPKLHNCFESLEKGVQEIRIGNSSIFSQKNQFTKIKK